MPFVAALFVVYLFDPAIVKSKGGRTPILGEQLGEPAAGGQGGGEELSDEVGIEHRDGSEFYEPGPTDSRAGRP